MDRKVLVYVAGPYRAYNERTVSLNIHRASELALKVWELGAVAICPHKNTAYFGGALPDEVWLQGDLEIIRRCDAVIMLPAWQTSQGATAEEAFAASKGIPVFMGTHALHDLQIFVAVRNELDRKVASPLSKQPVDA